MTYQNVNFDGLITHFRAQQILNVSNANTVILHACLGAHKFSHTVVSVCSYSLLFIVVSFLPFRILHCAIVCFLFHD
jgi:hypothetical protein